LCVGCFTGIFRERRRPLAAGGASPLQKSTAWRVSWGVEMTQLVGEPPEPDDELLTLYQVAELLYAHPETVNQWLRRG
jgi:hypothetical protein